MKLTGKENHKVSVDDAKRFVSGYKKEKAEFMRMEMKDHKEAKKGGFFGKEALLDLLNQPGCIGMRYYYGRSDDGQKNLVLVGVNEEGNDILPKPSVEKMAVTTESTKTQDNEVVILERSLPCPPFCDGTFD